MPEPIGNTAGSAVVDDERVPVDGTTRAVVIVAVDEPGVAFHCTTACVLLAVAAWSTMVDEAVHEPPMRVFLVPVNDGPMLRVAPARLTSCA
ncbi:hypothetical protein SDC9_212798 [bioreactor metagenome]|uniref:Uncharacterized protein n=1 Tax=bioreactor metagenome TaxID=1076179 RepID=A0A645JQM2_9ZZZZ